MKRTVLILIVAALGCAGHPYKLAVVEPHPERYEALGQGVGRATGVFVGPLFQIRTRNTIERAVEEAIRSKGGDELVDITVQQSWYYAVVFTGFVVEVRGTVLRDKNRPEAPVQYDRARDRRERSRGR